MKKRWILIAAVVGLAAILGGCQTGQTGTPTEQAGAQAETTAQADTSAETTVQADTSAETTVQAESDETAAVSEVTLYLTRHGKTILNTTGRMQGWSDAPLTEAGAAVAKKLGEGLLKAGIQFDAAYSSDSGRAVETAELVLGNNGQEDLPIQKSAKLREVCYGKYEGAMPQEAYHDAAELLGYGDVNELMGAVMGGTLSMPEAVSAMAETDDTKMAESWETAQARLMEGIKTVADQSMEQGEDQVLVVFHGMAISAVLNEIDPSAQVGELGNASITKIVYDGQDFRIESVNDMSYIEE